MSFDCKYGLRLILVLVEFEAVVELTDQTGI